MNFKCFDIYIGFFFREKHYIQYNDIYTPYCKSLIQFNMKELILFKIDKSDKEILMQIAKNNRISLSALIRQKLFEDMD